MGWIPAVTAQRSATDSPRLAVCRGRIAPDEVIPGAEPFYLPASGNQACLLIHGFTGSPAEMRPLGERLQQDGISSLAVRLPGHGTSLRDLERHNRRSWLAAAGDALHCLLNRFDRVTMCGLSMGGTIALQLAARVPSPRLIGLAVIGVPARLIDLRYRPSEIIQMLERWRDWGRPDIMDRSQWVRHIGYRLAPIGPTLQLVRLVSETYRLLPAVRQPLLVMHSLLDHTVPPVNVHWLLDRVGSRERRVVWLQGSYHVVTLDYEADRVASHVSDFFKGLPPS